LLHVPDAKGNADGIGLSASPENAVNRPAEHVALRFRGVIEIEAADVYTFELTSDDGSRLLIDGQVVVDNDGLHSSLAKRGRVALGAGIHTVDVGWFNKSGGAALALTSAPLGAPLAPLTVLPVEIHEVEVH
jgi:hypothetical protein